MSDLQNPIFDDDKEFLERQKLEYKNALLSDVTGLKEQTTQLGKSALLLGGALAGVWIIGKMVIGPGKKKKKKKKKAALKLLQSQNPNANPEYYQQTNFPVANASAFADDDVNFGSPLDFNQPVANENETTFYNAPTPYFNPKVSAVPANYALHSHYHAAQENAAREPSFLQSDLVRALATQAMAFVLVYLSKKAEEYMAKNHDIATDKGFETQDVDFSYLNTDAGEHL